MSKRHIIILICAGISLFLLIGSLSLIRQGDKNSEVERIDKQLSFKGYLPEYPFIVKSGTLKYDSSQSLLTMQVDNVNSMSLILSQQPYPETLIFDKLISSMNAQKEIGTGLGQVAITHPKSESGKQVAVLKADMTLIFVKSENKLSDSQWRDFFNRLNPI